MTLPGEAKGHIRPTVIFTIAFLLYASNPDVFERKLYFNEALSLMGFFLFAQRAHPLCAKSWIEYSVLFYVVYGMMHCLWMTSPNVDLVAFMRHSVLLYAPFSFYLGKRVYKELLISGGIVYDLLCLVPFQSIAFAPLTILAIVRRGPGMSRGYIAAIWLLFLFFFKLPQMSIALTSIVITGALALNARAIKVLFVVLPLLAMAGVMTYQGEIINFYRDITCVGVPMIGEETAFDANSLVRFAMLCFVLLDVLPDHPFGIGLGVKLFDEHFIQMVLPGEVPRNTDGYNAYYMSPHNSYLSLLLRFGIPMVPMLYLFYWRFFGELKKIKENNKNRVYQMASWLAFLSVSILASTNVVIESPIHAALFWGVLGLYDESRI